MLPLSRTLAAKIAVLAMTESILKLAAVMHCMPEKNLSSACTICRPKYYCLYSGAALEFCSLAIGCAVQGAGCLGVQVLVGG